MMEAFLRTPQVRQLLRDHGIPAKRLPLYSARQREQLYAAAYALYEEGAYERAADLFTRLLICAPANADLWYGLASSRQMETRYEEALRAWSACALLADSAQAHFHAAECLISLGSWQDALRAIHLAEALDTGALQPQLSALRAVCSSHLT